MIRTKKADLLDKQELRQLLRIGRELRTLTKEDISLLKTPGITKTRAYNIMQSARNRISYEKKRVFYGA